MRGLSQRNISNNFKRKAFQGCDLGGMVRQQLYTTQAKVMKYLGADAIVSINSIAGLHARIAFSDMLLLHNCISP